MNPDKHGIDSIFLAAAEKATAHERAAYLDGVCGADRELRERIERALAQGQLPSDANPAALAKYVVTVQNGIAVQSAGGATREELLAAVDIAMKAWPV